MIKSKREALAQHFNLDFAETEDFRYHQGRTTQPVYAFTDFYICITKGGQKPATHRDGFEWNWVEIKDDFVNKFGYNIWKSTNAEI